MEGYAAVLRTMTRRLGAAPDTWERHALAARLVGDAQDVLDVGGAAGFLSGMLPGRSVVTANLHPPADVVWDGGRLPFGAGTFDAVTSLDVLEHLHPADRPGHLGDLVRVARRRVVVCCPLGTPAHVALERTLSRRRRSRFLLEHLEHELPSESELRALAVELPGTATFLFHGDFRLAAHRFRHPIAARLAPRRNLALHEQPGVATNRVFLVLELPPER